MMKSVLTAAALLSLLASSALAQDAAPQAGWSLAIHGGAGVIERASLSPERDALYRAGLKAALDAGSAVLAQGGTALDAVESAVQVLEDNPLFNAGHGAVFTSTGRNEMDAAIMDGTDLNAGAVAGLTRTRNPITVARAIMEQSPHVMLIGEGAETFARQSGAEEVEPAYFFTESRWQALLKTLRERGEPIPARPAGAPPEPAQHGPAAPLASLMQAPLDEKKFGTVGAVARDSQGRLAAATSTGGTTAKRWGRVGDVPVIGAGTYASNAEGCAVSATGTGEYFIRATVARDICHRTARGLSVQAAADAEIAEVGQIGGDGGVIVVGSDGSIAFAMNTSGMYRATVGSDRPARVAIYADEEAPK
ncbi:isoaspartyl peptidase/L-asparaginase family protein [Brevundimonas vesicularis]|uniref:isoaspartyl peptidase/L-asparaginase family protein n=1 Tax=Brevundimonas vesicularis TaxID=41276 RepID=UPI0038D394E5